MVSTSFLVASVAVTKLRCPRTELCIEPSQIIEQSQILFSQHGCNIVCEMKINFRRCRQSRRASLCGRTRTYDAVGSAEATIRWRDAFLQAPPTSADATPGQRP